MFRQDQVIIPPWLLEKIVTFSFFKNNILPNIFSP